MELFKLQFHQKFAKLNFLHDRSQPAMCRAGVIVATGSMTIIGRIALLCLDTISQGWSTLYMTPSYLLVST